MTTIAPSLRAAVTPGSRHSGRPAQLHYRLLANLCLIGCGVCFFLTYLTLNNPEYAGSLNLDRMGLTDAAKERVRGAWG